MNRRKRSVLLAAAVLCVGSPVRAEEQAASTVNPPPKPADWAAIAKLPDWSGVWTPYISDQDKRIKTDPVPWQPKVAEQIAALVAEEKAGRPKGLFIDCLPEGMPTWMLITHNAFEFLFTPGRVTILGEMDGNRLRRIYTDGRPHPADPDPTFHGHSIGHWEGETLVVDTIGVLPQGYLAVSEAVGIPNNGDLHVIERIHLTATRCPARRPAGDCAPRTDRTLEDDAHLLSPARPQVRHRGRRLPAGLLRGAQRRQGQRRVCARSPRRRQSRAADQIGVNG